MARNDIPTNSREFRDWVQNFAAVLALNAATVGLAPADVTPISDASDAFAASFADYETKKMVASAATAVKINDQRVAMDILRPLVQRICKHPGMNDGLRRMLGLGTDDMAMSAIPISQLPPPEVYLEMAVGAVRIHWGPNPQNEQQNGKPVGVKGANIYRKKTGEADFQRMEFVTSSPYLDPITGDAADYSYIVRYRGSKPTDLGLPSPAETIAARGELAA